MTQKEEYEKSMSDLVNSPNIPDETKHLSILIYSLGCISDQLGEINKNLEKIANNTEKVHTTGYMRTELNKGEFYGPIKKELNLDTIICNQNKDLHVDKNVILD